MYAFWPMSKKCQLFDFFPYRSGRVTIKLASSELNKVVILESEDSISLDGTLTAGNLAFLLDINGESLLLAFGVLDDELEDTIDLE